MKRTRQRRDKIEDLNKTYDVDPQVHHYEGNSAFLADDNDSHKSSHHSHISSSHSHHEHNSHSSSRRYKSVSSNSSHKKHNSSSASHRSVSSNPHKSNSSSLHRSASSASHRSLSSAKAHVKFPLEEEYHSTKEKRIQLIDSSKEVQKPESNDLLIQKIKQRGPQRIRRQRRQIKESSPKDKEDELFSLIEDNRKLIIHSPIIDDSSQFDTMTNEEIEFVSKSPNQAYFKKENQKRSAKYDFEVFFAARFASSARDTTVRDYYNDLSPVPEQNARERAGLASTISTKVADYLQGNVKPDSNWEKIAESLLKWNIDELIYLVKRYIEISDLQLTKFFTTEDINPSSVPSKYIDSLTLTGIKDPRIGDRTHIFSCHMIQTDVSEVFNRIKEMSKVVGRMGDIFGECVFNYTINWLILFPEDFNKDFFKIFRSAMKEVITVANESKFLLYLSLSLASALSKKQIPISKVSEMPRTRPLLHSQWGVPPLGVPPQAIVDHFTFVEAEEISKISLNDILRQKLIPIVSGFNATCDFICRHILADDLKSRVTNLSYWIDTMVSAAKAKNLFLVFEISASLNNPAIMRLHKTWNLVSTDLKDKFYAVDELTNPSYNYKAMRDFISSTPKRDALPFALAFVRMAEQARAIPNTEGIDMMKIEVMGSLGQQVKAWGIKTYPVDEKVVDFVRSIKEKKITDQSDISIDALSKKLEPPKKFVF